MENSASLHKRMDEAFENYLVLSKELQNDMIALLNSEEKTQHWRRNFIRTIVPLIEGEVNCLKEICLISLECESPELTNKETKVLLCENSFSTDERIKLTLRISYKLFELLPVPDFGGNEWVGVQIFLKKRHLLMHPKTAIDLDVSDKSFDEIRENSTWLMTQFFNILTLLDKKYG